MPAFFRTPAGELERPRWPRPLTAPGHQMQGIVERTTLAQSRIDTRVQISGDIACQPRRWQRLLENSKSEADRRRRSSAELFLVTRNRNYSNLSHNSPQFIPRTLLLLHFPSRSPHKCGTSPRSDAALAKCYRKVTVGLHAVSYFLTDNSLNTACIALRALRISVWH
jgi:hypothetical protein